MTDAITASLARQSGLMNELSVLANNIANASTDGFKREASVFAEYIKVPEGEASVSMGALRGHFPDTAPGTLRETGGRLDLAIEGEGWFAVQRGDEVMLTRAGRFQRDADGLLVTPEGRPVLDEAGSPVQLPEGAAEITVGPDGTVTADGFGVAQIGVLLADPASISRAGENLWRNEGPLRFADEGRIRQGFVETSNVSPVEEMARLIETQRAYEAGAAFQTNEHERLRSLIEAMRPSA